MDLDDNMNNAADVGILKRCRIHVIKKGDTLYELAREYDVQIYDIMRLNPYLNVYDLQIGDEVLIPTMNDDVSDRN